MQITVLWTFLLFISLALADVSISNPSIGQTFDGSDGTATVSVKWIDDGNDQVPLKDVEKYSIVLCTGPNNNIKPVKTYTTSLSGSETGYDLSIKASDVPNGEYFVQVFAKVKNGYTIHYTNRFKLTGMSGSAGSFTFPGSLFSVTGDKPTPQIDVSSSSQTINSASFTVPYTLQTGTWRFAPMQLQPGTTVTHTAYSTRHPSSAYTPFTSISPSPNVYSTITPGWSYSVVSKINSAPVAPYPTYYYPASSRVSQASLSSARRRRWLD